MNRTLAFVFLGAVCSFAQSPVNLSFEAGTVGQTPQGWGMSSSPTTAGFSGVVVDTDCRRGGRCVLLSGPSSPSTDSFGNLAQTFTPGQYSMKRVRFRAAARVEGVNTRLQYWMRVDRRGGGSSFFDNMITRPVTSSTWSEYEIDGMISDDTERVYIGFLLFGPGKAWVDEVTFTVTGSMHREPAEPSKPLSDTGLANLTAFAKVYGYVRFFHPSDGVEQQDWEVLAIDGARRVENAATPEDLAKVLEEIFKPVAPNVTIRAASAKPQPPGNIIPSSRITQLVRWDHYGVRLGPDTNSYQSRRVRAPFSTPMPPGFIEQPYVAEIGRGLVASVPLTVVADDNGTLPAQPSVASPDIWLRDARDRGTRIGGVIIAWNVLRHFYPYFDITDVDWPAELAKGLKSAALGENANDYIRTIEYLIAALKDGHGSVTQPNVSTAAPLIWDWVEGQLIVTETKGTVPVVRGDRVFSVDGVKVEDAIADLSSRISGATPQWIRTIALRRLTYCDNATFKMTLEIEPWAQLGTRKTVELPCFANFNTTETKPERIAELEPGIMYVDIDRITDADWARALPQLAQAKGIIFDLRGYPRTSTYLAHLTNEPITSAQWWIPTPAKPDQVDMTFRAATRWNIPPAEPSLLGAKRVFLTGGGAISYAESVMGIVENYKLAHIVGSTSAGTNGNINVMTLPAGLRAVFTGMRVLKHDGSRHHGIGIEPTVPVDRTRMGVAYGVDEVLDHGLFVIRHPSFE